MKNFKSIILLTITAVIWGFAFTSQKTGMNHVGPFTYNCVRSLLGAIFLIPCIALIDRFRSPIEREGLKRIPKKLYIIGGCACGAVLAFASSTQQIGIMYTTVGQAGFITACYIILVPIIGIFLKKSCSLFVWISVVLAVIALYLLCLTESFTINKGDFFVLICSFLFAGHILVIDFFSPKMDGVRLSCVQFFISGLLCSIPMFIMEGVPAWKDLVAAAIPILYAGIMSCGVAYTLQIVAQKDCNPTVASIVMSLESAFAVLGGWLFLDETLSGRQYTGCAIMFVAILLAQIPPKRKRV